MQRNSLILKFEDNLHEMKENINVPINQRGLEQIDIISLNQFGEINDLIENLEKPIYSKDQKYMELLEEIVKNIQFFQKLKAILQMNSYKEILRQFQLMRVNQRSNMKVKEEIYIVLKGNINIVSRNRNSLSILFEDIVGQDSKKSSQEINFIKVKKEMKKEIFVRKLEQGHVFSGQNIWKQGSSQKNVNIMSNEKAYLLYLPKQSFDKIIEIAYFEEVDEILKKMQQIEVFKGFNESLIWNLLSNSQEKIFHFQEFIIKKNSTVETFFIVLEGEIIQTIFNVGNQNIFKSIKKNAPCILGFQEFQSKQNKRFQELRCNSVKTRIFEIKIDVSFLKRNFQNYQKIKNQRNSFLNTQKIYTPRFCQGQKNKKLFLLGLICKFLSKKLKLKIKYKRSFINKIHLDQINYFMYSLFKNNNCKNSTKWKSNKICRNSLSSYIKGKVSLIQ